MSGIAGVIHFNGAPVEPGLVEKMTGAMASRGPDGIKHWVGGSLALGQCMLRTTPESLEETQPLGNEGDSLVLVLDGRVDNRDELRRELLGQGAVLRDRSDAELVLKSYEVWGDACPDRIIGEFAFFVWDARQRRLFGARDAAGTRHFYYHAAEGWFGFSSEIKGLLALRRFEPRLNESRLLDYLVQEFDRDDEVGTFYQGISRLPAGHALSVTERGVRTWRYWNPGALQELRFASLDECAEAFLEQLRLVVKCRLRSIGPVGATLSGGLDSSSIVGLISKEFRGELAQPLRTFSLIRDDREHCPEWQSIRQMLGDGWLEPSIITSAIPPELCQTFLGEIADADEPFMFTHGLTEFVAYKAARESGCRVVLEGMAGDLLFFGPERTLDTIFRHKTYARIPGLLAAQRRHGMERGVRNLVRKSLASVTPESVRAVFRRYRGKHVTLDDNLKLLRVDTGRRFLTMRTNQREHAAGLADSKSDQALHAQNFVSGLLSFAHEIYGQMALSTGVETRSPFSDRRMIEFAIRMPVEGKLFATWYKHVLRKSMAGILPEPVRWRRDVGGHPGRMFYRQLIANMVQHAPDLCDPGRLGSILSRWIDRSSVAREWRDYEQRADFSPGFNLYILAVLAQWLGMHPGIKPSGRDDA